MRPPPYPPPHAGEGREGAQPVDNPYRVRGERFAIFFAAVNPTITSLPRLTTNNAIERLLARNQGPIIEVQNHGRIVILARLVGKVRARPVLCGNETKSQRADVGAVR